VAAVAVTEMLESVTELLDARSSATPRKLRKRLLELLIVLVRRASGLTLNGARRRGGVRGRSLRGLGLCW
jgi:hypothetical protein